MEQLNNSYAQHHEIQHLLIALDKLGKDFGHNRDTYYSLGRYLGYTDLSLLRIESWKDPLSWILCDTAVKKFSNDIPEFKLNMVFGRIFNTSSSVMVLTPC